MQRGRPRFLSGTARIRWFSPSTGFWWSGGSAPADPYGTQGAGTGGQGWRVCTHRRPLATTFRSLPPDDCLLPPVP